MSTHGEQRRDLGAALSAGRVRSIDPPVWVTRGPHWTINHVARQGRMDAEGCGSVFAALMYGDALWQE